MFSIFWTMFGYDKTDSTFSENTFCHILLHINYLGAAAFRMQRRSQTKLVKADLSLDFTT